MALLERHPWPGNVRELQNVIQRAAILAALDEATAAEAITEAEPEVQASMVQMMEPEKAADILEEMEPDEAADILSDLPEAKADAKAAASGQPGAAEPAAVAAAPAGTVTDDARRSSVQHYQNGIAYFMKADYANARNEWNLALQLDPGNSDAKAGLERIDKLYGGR